MYSGALERTRGEDTANAKTDETDRSAALSWVTDLERRTLGAGAESQNP